MVTLSYSDQQIYAYAAYILKGGLHYYHIPKFEIKGGLQYNKYDDICPYYRYTGIRCQTSPPLGVLRSSIFH